MSTRPAGNSSFEVLINSSQNQTLKNRGLSTFLNMKHFFYCTSKPSELNCWIDLIIIVKSPLNADTFEGFYFRSKIRPVRAGPV